MLALALAHAQVALAACKEPLPSIELRPLDALVDTDPLGSVERARTLLGGPSVPAFRRAELFAIIADAYDTTSDDVEARRAVADGRAALRGLEAALGSEGLARRFALVEADAAQGRDELEAAVRRLDALERQLQPRSLGHACLLLVRSRARSRLQLHEQATADGLRAHAIATELQARDARIEAAFQLSTTFRRAGLLDQALEFADEAIAGSRASGQKAALATALFGRAQILDELQRADDALRAVGESRRLSVDLGDAVGRAFADNETCAILLGLRRVDAAEASCRAAYAGFTANGRVDQASGAQFRLARIELLRRRPAAALAWLDRALADDGRQAPPTYLAQLHRLRADALEELGRTGEALQALRRADEMGARADALRRSLAASALTAQHRFEEYERSQRALRSQLQLERQLAQNRELQRRMAYSIALGTALLAILLAWLLLSARRHARALRRQEVVLRTTAENSPDALVLLDAGGRVRFASRPLLGPGVTPQRGRPLVEAVEEAARGAVAEVVRRTIEAREPAEVDLQLHASGNERHFELRGRPIIENGQLIGATLRAVDVSERRALEHKLLEVVAHERQRVSSDLHEGLGQELTGVALQLRALATTMRSGQPAAAREMDTLIELVDSAIGTTRNLAHGLSPMQIDRGSLAIALERLAADAGRRLALRVRSRSTPADLRLPSEVADHLYRIASEAVTNAARHARATQIDIDLRVDAAAIELVVSDDGCGFDPRAERSSGWGTRMMAYRAALIGGTLRIESASGHGTRVIASVPRPSARPVPSSLASTLRQGARADDPPDQAE